jgi:hypothetical protein
MEERIPSSLLRRRRCAACLAAGDACREHDGIDEAAVLGRLWAEDVAGQRVAAGLVPGGPWLGTLEDASLKLVEASSLLNERLEEVVLEAAQARWLDIGVALAEAAGARGPRKP